MLQQKRRHRGRDQEPAPAPQQFQAVEAKPVNALGLMWTVLVARLKRLFSRAPA